MLMLLGLIIVSVSSSGILAQTGAKPHYPILANFGLNSSISSSGNIGEAGHYAYTNNGTLLFINRTLSSIPSGLCFKEVPTVSLVKGSVQVPAGNGSNPSLSRIQVCCEGYERNPHNFRKCDPICKNECVNGLCVAPNVCRCFPDHVLNLGGYCIPTCPIGCGNGDCQPDRSCKCKPGYVLEPMRKFCVPTCMPGCQNGNCTEPNVCECNTGYERAANGACVPKCENCENGRCTAPGVCACLPGYKRQTNKCLPVCDRGCNSGFCIAPNTCSCERGYSLNKAGNACTPHCDTPCLNGECKGPNQCKCHQGYIIDPATPSICRPHCPSGCPNGVCSGPDFCICNAGFIKDRSNRQRQACVPAQ